MQIRSSSKPNKAFSSKPLFAAERLEARHLLAVVPFPFTTSSEQSWGLSDASIVRSVDTTGALSGYTVRLEANQKLNVSITDSNAPVLFTLRDSNGEIYSAASLGKGQAKGLLTGTAATAGTWTIGVAVQPGTTGTYQLEVAVNSVIETTDSTVAAPLSLGSSTTTLVGGAVRQSVYGSSSLKSGSDVDVYSFDMTGKVGHVLDLRVASRNGENLAGQTLQLISPTGTILATGIVDPTNSKGLLISNYTAPSSGVFSARLTSSIAADYSLTVTDLPADQTLSATSLLTYIANNGWSTLSDVPSLVKTISFDRAFQSLQTNELLGLLISAGILNGYADVNAVVSALPAKGVVLTDLRPDGVLNALGNANGGSLLTWLGSPISASDAKLDLQDWYAASPLRFLNAWTPDNLIQLLDDSITSTAGAAASPIQALATWTTPSGVSNIHAGYVLWIHDSNGTTNIPSVAEAVKAVNAMPSGSRTIFATDYLEVLGFGGGRGYADSNGNHSGYVDPTDGAGQPAIYYTIWMDHWQAAVQSRIATFFGNYKAQGGKLDYLALDVESNGLSYWDITANEHRVDVNVNPAQTIWQAILADPRWPVVRAQLINAGLTANDLTLSAISNWNPKGREAAIWDGVMQDRLAAYLNAAVYQPLRQIFPNVKLSNYNSYARTSTVPAGQYTLFSATPFTDSPLVGNRSSVSVYGLNTNITTPAGVIAPATPFSLAIKNISFAQHQTGAGAWTKSGTTTLQLFQPYVGLKAGDWITIENRGGTTFIDPQYLGKYQVYSVSPDGLTVRYLLPIANAATPPAAKDLSNRSTAAYSAYVSTWRPYNAFVSDMSFIRTQVAASTVPQLPWIASSDWLGRFVGSTYTYYPELVMQAALNGTENFLYWKDNGFGVNGPADVVLDNILKEINALVGFADRRPLVFNAPSWADGYVLSGVEANGKRVYRLTPDPTQSVSVSTAGGNVSFTIGDRVVSIPNATIYTPANATSTLGYWIVQTRGVNHLTQSAAQIQQRVESALAPIVTSPAIGQTGQSQYFSFALNSALLATNTRVAFDVDWNNDGKTDQTVQGVGNGRITGIYSSVGNFTMRVTPRLLDTNESLPSVTWSIQIVNTSLTLAPNAANPKLLDLVYTGTSGNDQLILKTLSPGVLQVTVGNNGGPLTSYTYTNITGRVIASGGGGNDTFDARQTSTPVTFRGGSGNSVFNGGSGADQIYGGAGDDSIFGGAGNDYLVGGGGKDIILGGDGDDVIQGGIGRAVIIGGQGADTIVAGQSDNLIISGTTAWDADLVALAAIQAEWDSTRSFAERAANINGGGTGPRLNGSYTLIPGTSVLDDAAVDRLFAGPALQLVALGAGDVLSDSNSRTTLLSASNPAAQIAQAAIQAYLASVAKG